MVGVKVGVKFLFKASNIIDWHRVHKAMGQSVKQDNLLFNGNRLVQRLLQYFDGPPAAGQLGLRCLVQVTAELGKAFQFPV